MYVGGARFATIFAHVSGAQHRMVRQTEPLRHRRKKSLREDQPGRSGIAQMICRNEKRQHRRHDALVEVVGEVAGGKQSYRFVIGRLGMLRVGRYFGRGTHEPLYLAEDRDRKQPPQKPRRALTVRTRGQLVLRIAL